LLKHFSCASPVACWAKGYFCGSPLRLGTQTMARQVDVLSLSDGTKMDLTRLPEVDDKTWGEVKEYLEENPQVAKNLERFARNPDAIRGWLQTQAIAEHYNAKLSGGDSIVQDRILALEKDPELANIFEDIKKNGLESALQHCNNEELMLKISRKMGGVPADLQPVLQKIEETPLTLHEACKHGNLKQVQEHMSKQQPVDTQDHKGITPLGYAIGANKIAVVKQLLDYRANPFSVDATGNSGLHYASGYGRKELVEYLLSIRANANQANAQGQTPLKVASMNKQAATLEILQQHGALM